MNVFNVKVTTQAEEQILIKAANNGCFYSLLSTKVSA